MVRIFNSNIDHPVHLDQQSLIQIISDMGIDFISSIQQSTQIHQYKLQNSNIQYENDLDWGFGFYLLHGLRDGYYSQNDFSRSTTGIVDIAKQLLRSNPSEKINRPKNSNNQRSTVHDIRSEGPFPDLDDQLGYEFLTTIDELLKEEPSINYDVDLECLDIKKSVQNSEDNNIIHLFNKAKLTIELYDRENVENSVVLQFGGIQKSDCDINQILKNLQRNIKILKSMRNARKITSGEYPLILSPDTTYSLIHESIGHGCEADQVINNQSFLSNKLGYKVGSSNLTITDDPHLRGVGWSEYDDEGTKTKGTLLVEDGILTDFLHTRKTANLFGSPPTGNARATNYLDKPDARQSNLFVEPKDLTVEEMLENIKSGIYIGPTNMASTSIYTGEMYIQCQYARRIENGELAEFVKPVTITGNALYLLNSVSMIGNEIEKFPTECSKSQSRLDIGGYAPSISLSSAYLE